MARPEWGYSYNGRGVKWCSYKRTTIVVCSVNIAFALYVLHTLYTSLYTYPYGDSQNDASYTPEQIRKMEESIQIRKKSEPMELIKLVEQVKYKIYREEGMAELPQHLKRQITAEILERLKSLNASANSTLQHEAVERWRHEKLEDAKKMIYGKTVNSTIALEEASMLARALELDWPKLSEEIGLWIPIEIINKEHDDKPEGEEDYDAEILPGRRLAPECNMEIHTDYGGAAVRWGLTHHKESAYDCCRACLDQAQNAKPGEMKCNIWVYCPSESGCYSPDIYEHKLEECWLKYAAKPQVTFKGTYSESYRNSHPTAPLIVSWVSGVIRPR